MELAHPRAPGLVDRLEATEAPDAVGALLLHGSTFRVDDGSVVRGRAGTPQPGSRRSRRAAAAPAAPRAACRDDADPATAWSRSGTLQGRDQKADQRAVSYFASLRAAPSVAPSVIARVAGTLYVFGAFLVGLSLLLPHPPQADVSAMVALVVFAALFGLAVLAGAERARVWLLHAVIALGSVLICAAIYLSGVATGVFATMFVWVVLMSAFFFPGAAAATHLAWLLAVYGATLATMDSSGYSHVTRWLLVALALAMASGMTSWLVLGATRLKRRVERFFSVSIDMFCTADAQGRFVEVNAAWTRSVGYRKDELVGRAYVELVHPEDRARMNAETRRLFAGHDSIDFENRYRARDGSYRWLRWTATVDADEELIYARATDVTELKRLDRERERLLEEVRAQARTDHLTGIPNRRWLENELEREIARAERHRSSLCVAFLDLDRFKAYNDAHGHPAGDTLLRRAADAWRGGLRVSDFIARYGGEEFVVLLPEAGPDEAGRVVERLRALTPEGQTCSAGLAYWQPGLTADAVIARADAALYEAKEAGRDQMALATPFAPALTV